MEIVGGFDLAGADRFVELTVVDGATSSGVGTVMVVDDLAAERDRRSACNA